MHDYQAPVFTRRVLFCLAAVWACQPSAPAVLTDAEKAAIADSARQIVDSAFAAVVRVDAPGLMRHFIVGPEATFSADGMIIPGHDSIASYFRTAFAGWRSVDSASLSNVRAAVLSRDAAVVTLNYRERVTDTTAKQFWNAGAWSSTVARRDGSWKIVDAHASHPRAP